MMINKRLIGAVPESKKYIAGNVALQWCSLCANIAMMSAVTALLAALYAGSMTQSKIVTTAVIALAAVAVRYGCTCLLYTSPSPRDRQKSRMPSSA